MSDKKAARLAAIRAANAAGQAGAPPPAPLVNAAPAVIKAPVADELDMMQAMPFHTLFLTLLAVSVGVFAAVVVLPTWLPGLSDSLLSAEPKAYWYLARSSAFVAYALLWLAMLFGLLITSRTARVWPGGPVAFDLHQHASLLGLSFALFHSLILLGDRYIQADLRQVLVPFAYSGHSPLWVGLGQVGLYLMGLVGLSFYLKDLIGRGAWRAIHVMSFAMFILALTHGIGSGSDSGQPLIQGLYWFTGGSVLFLSVYRILVTGQKRQVSVRREA